MITFQIILNMNNLLSEIIKFLSFKDKIHFSKYSSPILSISLKIYTLPSSG